MNNGGNLRYLGITLLYCVADFKSGVMNLDLPSQGSMLRKKPCLYSFRMAADEVEIHGNGVGDV